MQFEHIFLSVFILSDKQIIQIKEAKAEYLKGNFLTEEEANKDIEKWLEEEN